MNFYSSVGNLDEENLGETEDQGFTDSISGSLVVPSLMLSCFGTYPAAFAVLLLLVEISETFQTSLGVTSQIQTVASIVAVASALILGILSVRVQARSLMLVGLSALVLASLGCGLAPTFPIMIAAYALTGVGGAVVPSMAFTLVADYFPAERRSKVIGRLIAASTLSGVVGLPAIGYISENWGWRYTFLGFALPLAVIGLAITWIGLPAVHQDDSEKDVSVLDGYKAVFGKASAVGCLLATVFAMIAWQGATLYSPSFYREHFALSVNHTSLFLTLSTLVFAMTGEISSFFIDRFGRKTVTIMSLLLSSLTIMSFTVTPLFPSLSARLISSFFVSLSYSASSAITLEQVPRYRGAIMSLNMAAGSLGVAIGSALSGLVFLMYGFMGIGPILGSMMIISSLVMKFLVVDPS